MPKLLAAVVLGVMWGGCASNETGLRAPQGAKSLRVEARSCTHLWIACRSSLLGSDFAFSPAIRFDLSPIPADAIVRSAILRLRRGYERISDRSGPVGHDLDVTNVNRGLRIRQARASEDWKRAGRIEAADATALEDELWQSIPDTAYRGMDLVQAAYNKKDYLALLKTTNPTISARLAAGAGWDEIDVTSFVLEELAGDRSLTLLLSSTQPIELQWFDQDSNLRLGRLKNGPESYPHLLISYDTGGPPRPAPRERTPAKGSGRIVINSTPAPAKIYIDGEFVGTTVEGQPVELPVSSDRVLLRLVKKGYKPWEETLKLTEGAPAHVHAELDRE